MTNEFLTWFSTWGSVMYAFMQMFFWLAVGFAAVYAAIAYKRMVDSKIAHHAAKDAASATPAAPKIDIDQFVE